MRSDTAQIHTRGGCRFGRIVDLLWGKYGTDGSSSSSSSGANAELVHLMYGYDRASNRTYRRDEVARSDNKTFDELYEYDRLNQVKKFHRGLLIDDNAAIESPGLQQGWQFDATGNWKNFTQFDPADAAKTLDQQRSHNRVNEITEIARTVGADWTTPTYERNGNTTSDEDGKKFKYDAWNHLVEVRDVENELLATYRYNALGWRVQEIRGEATTDLFYSNQWQVLEELVDGDVYAQYVWSLVYIDAMILRDRDSDGIGSLDERLYAVHDANFNTVALLDTSGDVVERFAYDAYGVFSVLTPGWGARGSSSYGWNYLHQGGRWDSDGGLYSFRHREYSPTLGRWSSIDPLGYESSESNLYRYVSDSPLHHLDPSGCIQYSDYYHKQYYTGSAIATDNIPQQRSVDNELIAFDVQDDVPGGWTGGSLLRLVSNPGRTGTGNYGGGLVDSVTVMVSANNVTNGNAVSNAGIGFPARSKYHPSHLIGSGGAIPGGRRLGTTTLNVSRLLKANYTFTIEYDLLLFGAMDISRRGSLSYADVLLYPSIFTGGSYASVGGGRFDEVGNGYISDRKTGTFIASIPDADCDAVYELANIIPAINLVSGEKSAAAAALKLKVVSFSRS